MSDTPENAAELSDPARTVDPAWVQQVAHLARLDLTPDEASAMAPQLARILEHVQGLPPLEEAGPEEDAVAFDTLRDDVPEEPLRPQDILRNAPQTDGSWIVVPHVFENDGAEPEADA